MIGNLGYASMAAVILCGGTTLVVLPGAPCVSDKVGAWVSAQGSDLPRDLLSIEKYPMATRTAILAALPRGDQLNVWREHLGRFRGDQRLNARQRDALESIISDLAPFTSPSTQPERAAVELRIKATFGRRLASELFGTIGTLDSLRAGADACNCNVGSICSCITITGPAEECLDVNDSEQTLLTFLDDGPPESCDEAGPPGCGCFLLFECNGYCWPEDPQYVAQAPD
jgi:hypothetical protein